jgi:hypothetical protein
MEKTWNEFKYVFSTDIFHFYKKGYSIKTLTTDNNISVILVEKTGVPGENYQPIASH